MNLRNVKCFDTVIYLARHIASQKCTFTQRMRAQHMRTGMQNHCFHLFRCGYSDSNSHNTEADINLVLTLDLEYGIPLIHLPLGVFVRLFPKYFP